MLTIETDRRAYPAGCEINAIVSLRRDKPVKARGLFVRLTCTERRQVKNSVVLDRYDYDRDKEIGMPYSSHMETRVSEHTKKLFEQEIKVCGEEEFLEGKYSVLFILPKNAKPTSREFGHDDRIHVWRISAKLDIPFAIDENAEEEIVVAGL